MPLAKRTPTKNEVATAEQNAVCEYDAEVIAYFEAQRKTTRSEEWVACLDAMIRQLRRSSKLPS